MDFWQAFAEQFPFGALLEAGPEKPSEFSLLLATCEPAVAESRFNGELITSPQGPHPSGLRHSDVASRQPAETDIRSGLRLRSPVRSRLHNIRI